MQNGVCEMLRQNLDCQYKSIYFLDIVNDEREL